MIDEVNKWLNLAERDFFSAKKIGADIGILDVCANLNPVYIEARYPDVPTSYKKEEIKKLLKNTEKVLKWIKTNL
ncbi:MAG TPA: HEPN domain-containing protein [archaeon]|nr:HEPN domain-containing protein [archaeon]